MSIATLTGENGLLTQAENAKNKTTEAEIEEQMKLAVMGSYGTDGKLDYDMLKTNLENIKGISGIPDTITEDTFPFTVTSVEGYEVEILKNGNIEIKQSFNNEEWDKDATAEDCFVWGSDIEGEEGYNVIIGYTEKLQSYSKVKIPSRCKKIICDGSYYSNNTYRDDQIGRAYFSNIEKIYIPGTVLEIGSYAFGSVHFSQEKLKEVVISNGVTNIGICAFYRCTGLTNITIPDSVTSIGDHAFCWCTSLTSITIPDSVTSMESYVFAAWTSSQTINIQGYSSAPEGWDSEWNSDCSAQINWDK